MNNIDDMPAGREMDAQIAEKVMGMKTWVGATSHTVNWMGPTPGDSATAERIPPYSTDIAWAWKLVDRLDHLGYDLGRVGKEFGEGLYLAQFYHGRTYGQACQHSRGETPALAIARAAFKAIQCPVVKEKTA